MKLNKLTSRGIDTLPPGTYGDGGGLWLRVKSSTSRSWFFRYVRGGRDTWMGLGDAGDVTLKIARERATKWRLVLADHRDPLAEKRKEEAERRSGDESTWFRNVAALYIETNALGWKSKKHAAQWSSTLGTYVYPIIGAKSVREITVEDVLACLTPIWTTKLETASRLRGRIEAVLAFAAARGWRDHFNPAAWPTLKTILPAKNRVAATEHHSALPYAEMAKFMIWLSGKSGNSARALEFCILTATRTDETLGATCNEFNLVGKIWTIPKERTKNKKEHKVPLSPATLAILDFIRAQRPDPDNSFVFPGAKPKRPLSNMSMAMLIRDDWPKITVHGFRSAFRDWGGEQTTYPRELLERALAHSIKSKAEAAYARGTMVERRRSLMEAWAGHCLGTAGGNVEKLAIGA